MEPSSTDCSADSVVVKLEPTENVDADPGACCGGEPRPQEIGADLSADSWELDSCSSNNTAFPAKEYESIEYKDEPRRMCLVCGDVASGLHYGVASCEACKAFFKRTVQGSIEYVCPVDGRCQMTIRHRKGCPACRLKKCLLVGMLPEGVRRDRLRGGRQKYQSPAPGSRAPFSLLRKRRPMKSDKIYLEHQKDTGSDVSVKSESSSDDTSMPCGDDLVTALLRVEPQKVFAEPQHSLADNDYKFMTTLADLTDRELVATINWSKQVPGFSTLPLHDQMSLLRGSWLDIISVGIAFRSMPYNGDIVYAADFVISEEEASVYCIPEELDRVTRRLASKLTEMRVLRHEYVLLKAMLLFDPDSNLEYPEAVKQRRDFVYDALVGYENQRFDRLCPAVPSGFSEEGRGDVEDGRGRGGASRRIADLLLLLPLVVQNKYQSREFWFTVSNDNRLVLRRLLREMIEHMRVQLL